MVNPGEKSILVGVDEHEGALDAAALGAAIANTLGAWLVVAAAVDSGFLPFANAAGTDPSHDRYDRIFDAADSVLGDFPYRRLELEGDPADALVELARREGSDMVVVGRTHRGRIGRVYPGALADRLLERSPCPVAVAPPDYAATRHTGFGSIGVAYDGGQESKIALEGAATLARVLDCELRVITVAPLFSGVDDPLAQVRESAYRERHAVGVRAIDGVPVVPVFDRGEPAKTLARHGVEVDLLVIGSRSHGRTLRTVMGTTGSELVRIAPCPVIVVPRAGDETHAAHLSHLSEGT